MSQYSVGSRDAYRQRGQLLPVDGGYDTAGNLTRVPAEIEASRRLLPVGFWKGSGLSLMLDLVAALLSGGQATHQIPTDPEQETALSQVFLALDPASLSPRADLDALVDGVMVHLHEGEGDVRHPGQRTLEERARSLREGVMVDPGIWALVQAGRY